MDLELVFAGTKAAPRAYSPCKYNLPILFAPST